MCALFTPGLNMRKFLLVLVGFAAAPFSMANTLTDIDFFQLPGERFEVRMSFDTPPPQPKGYTIESISRFVVSFPNFIYKFCIMR